MPVGFSDPFVGVHVRLGQSPEPFHTVDVDSAVDILLVSVIDRPVDVAQSHQSLIPGVSVGEDLSVFPDSLPDDRFQNELLRVWNELEVDFSVAFKDSEHRLLPDFRSPSPSGQTLAAELSPGLFSEILEGSSVVALVHFHGAGELPAVALTLLDERSADGSVCAVHGTVLRKVENPLETTSGEADRKPVDELVPEPERDLLAGEECPRLETKSTPAVTTPIGGIIGLVDPVRLTVFTARIPAESRSQKNGSEFLGTETGRKSWCEVHFLIIARSVVA